MDIRSALPLAVIVGTAAGLVLAESRTPPAGVPAPRAAAPDLRVEPPPVIFDMPVVWNASVAQFVELFEHEQPDRMALYLKRAGRYEGMIRSKLRARGMPEDLLYLSMIESGFNPNARSTAQAVGLWQFMAPTARGYGLRIDVYVDERRDPEKATDAALRYLDDLYGQFGSWTLAAAAYNSGGGRVARIMREETGSVSGDDSDFWLIRDRLPRETREYVPLIFAATLVGKQPSRYGLDRVERWLPVRTDTVSVPGGTAFSAIARAAGTRESEVRRLNPHVVRGVTPPGEPFPVRIPDGRAATFGARFGVPVAPRSGATR
jgi:membrane-bound lytic murein transglycosylase D